MITMSAMERGDIDTFTDYTGVLISNVLKQEMITDSQEVYDRVKAGMEPQYQMQVSQSLGFSNTYYYTVCVYNYCSTMGRTRGLWFQL